MFWRVMKTGVRFEAEFRVFGGTGEVGAHTGVAIGPGVIQG